ncbi:hypothetical protein ZIOFF_060523 [Zingiber officinale]|uniref:Uncharacterized protein n=1 Tax=Zingiber officinale TaxID=94328 RepID=A0A8J5FBT7_ZINOF|nr:hypothetical protein ZIOFF_060523 [Zingiber officinale]
METHALAASYSLRSGVRPSSSVPLPSTHGLPCKQRHRVGFLLYSFHDSCLLADRRPRSSVAFVPRAAAEAHMTSPSLPMKEIASFAVPAGALLAVSFGENSSKWKLNHTNACGFKTLFLFSSSGQNLGLQVELDVANKYPLGSSSSQMYMNAYSVMPKFDCLDGIANLLLQHTVLWKVVGKLIMPKPKGSTSEIKKAPSSGLKWSFSPRTNLLSGGAAKLEKESRQKVNEFSKELRAFRSVDLSGNGILPWLQQTLKVGLKALDGVLQTNTMLKTLNLSGNNIGDEGAKCLSDILKGARVIADMLKENQTLRVLKLNNNMIEYSGFASLAGALVENKAIRSIHLKLIRLAHT